MITKEQIQEYITQTEGKWGTCHNGYNQQKTHTWAGDRKEILEKSEKYGFVSYTAERVLEIAESYEALTISELDQHLQDAANSGGYSFEDVSEEELEEMED